MKFTLIAACSLLFFMRSNAQTSFAIRGGFNYSTARMYFGQVKQSTGFVPGANFGLQLKTEFEGPLHFVPFIAYNSRGYINKLANGNQTRNLLHYINLAPVLSYDFRTGKHSSFFISAGPMAGLAISGKEQVTLSGISTTTKMRFSSSTDYGIFDLGLHGGLGYNFNKLFVEMAYQHGLASINNNEETDKRNIRNRTVCITLGYYFKSFL